MSAPGRLLPLLILVVLSATAPLPSDPRDLTAPPPGDGGGAGVPSYLVLDLGTLGGESSKAAGINPAGDVAGWSERPDGSIHGFLYRDGALIDLGTLPGGTRSRATDVNDLGQVAGWGGINAYGPLFRGSTQAFLWEGGAMVDLNTLVPAGTGWVLARAAAINDAGQIAGTGLRDGRPREFLLTPVTPSGS